LLQYDHLIGRPFKHGSTDCFGLVRDFYNENFDLGIPNYARPSGWWDHGFDLYTESFRECGFKPVIGHSREWRMGDGVLMAIRSKTINHAGIFINGKLLHHFVNRLSMLEDYRSLWRDNTIMVVRHPKVQIEQPRPQLVDFMEFLPDGIRSQLVLQPRPDDA
jgi:cell wall-associated NlpC family hydrolase